MMDIVIEDIKHQFKDASGLEGNTVFMSEQIWSIKRQVEII